MYKQAKRQYEHDDKERVKSALDDERRRKRNGDYGDLQSNPVLYSEISDRDAQRVNDRRGTSRD